jgi:hypothetical protein
MDTLKLSELVRTVAGYEIGNGTHQTITDTCQLLGLTVPGVDSGKSKRERTKAALESITEADILRLADVLLGMDTLRSADRNAIEDAIWTDAGYPTITKRARREIADAIDPSDLYIEPNAFDRLIGPLWAVDSSPLASILGIHDTSLHAEIKQHVHRNPGDWSVAELFERLGAFEGSDHRFALFLEGLASGDVRPNEEDQRLFVAAVNALLRREGLELRETGIQDGYPVFELTTITGAPKGKAKNLIFASSVKPDLRFRDAINNDVEVVTHADRVLIYDTPIGRNGLLWSDLQAWWMQKEGLSDAEEAKKTLYRRLDDCLPESSPPQRLFFRTYFETFTTAIPSLPALLPEVWLHWDPVILKQRGRDALLHSRMDFLMLLPGSRRVVIEIDGKQHYANDDGQADPTRYGNRSPQTAHFACPAMKSIGSERSS